MVILADHLGSVPNWWVGRGWVKILANQLGTKIGM